MTWDFRFIQPIVSILAVSALGEFCVFKILIKANGGDALLYRLDFLVLAVLFRQIKLYVRFTSCFNDYISLIFVARALYLLSSSTLKINYWIFSIFFIILCRVNRDIEPLTVFICFICWNYFTVTMEFRWLWQNDFTSSSFFLKCRWNVQRYNWCSLKIRFIFN